MTTPRRWLAISVRSSAGEPHVAELLPEALHRLAGTGAEESGEGVFTMYLPEPNGLDGGEAEFEAVERLLEETRRELEAYTGAPGLDLAWRWQEHEAWAETWRRGFRPRRVTDRLVVSPSWTDPELCPGELLVTLDPGVAFGTAEHPTTRGCLRLLDRVVAPGERWADVGSGSGILAIAAVRLGAEAVTALEPDYLSCAAAEENVARNGVEDHVRMLPMKATPELVASMGPFDGIVSNIESGVILSLLPAFRGVLEPGGHLIVSGLLWHEAEAVCGEASITDLELVEEDREEEWWSGLFRTGS